MGAQHARIKCIRAMISAINHHNDRSMYYQQNFQRAFGTFPLKGDELATALITALDVGYRAIDTAQFYENEKDIGSVLSSSRIKRDSLCITTKVANSNFSEDKFLPSVEQSLDKLKLEYVDVLLLHWPPADGDIEQPVEMLLGAHQKGYAKHIGVSNFTSAMLDKLITLTDLPIATNQVEFHPLLNQEILLKRADKTGIPLSSYCSVARGAALTLPGIIELAQQYERSAAQIVLRWILQKGVSINTMSTNPENIRDNYNIMDFSLSNADIAIIDAMTVANKRIVDKTLVPWAPEWD